MDEKSLQNKVLKYLRSIPDSFTMKLADSFTGGYPDILFIKGKAIFIELKSPARKGHKNGGLEPMQLWTIEEIHKAGGITYVCYSIDEVKKCLTNEKIVG